MLPTNEARAKAAMKLLADRPFLAAVKERGVAVEIQVNDQLSEYKMKPSALPRAMKEIEAKSAEKRKRGAEESASGSKLVIKGGQFCLRLGGGMTATYEPICNFTARIVEEQSRDDGAEKTRVFVIEGALAYGPPLPRVLVTPQEFAGELWPLEKWGARQIVYASVPRTASHLRAAIQTFSDPETTITYMHAGFREHDGKSIYLHAGGAVGAQEVSVDLEGLFHRYKLPDFAKDAADAVRISLDFLKTASKKVTLPLHSAVYRAPLQSSYYCDATLGVHGKSGSMKSSLVALAQSHWGDFDHRTLPLGWGATFSVIELHLHRMKDTLVTVDDYAPRSADQADELHKKGAQVIRHIGNGSARSRLKSDCTARADRPCRALVVSTGEDLPKGESVQARLVAIRMTKDDVNLDELTKLQANKHRLSHAMVACVEWLMPRMGQLKAEVERKFREFRDDMQQKHGHLRAPAAMAHLLVGAYYFTEFAKDLGVMSDEDAERHLDEVRAALVANYREQVKATEQSNPGRRFLEVLRDLLLRRKVLLKPKGQSFTMSSDDIAEPIGWQDKTHAYLLPDAAFPAVSKVLKSMNEETPLQQYGLWSRMMEEGLILAKGDGPTHRLDVNGDGKRERVLKIELTMLQGEPDTWSPDDVDPGGGSRGDGPDDDGEGGDCEPGVPPFWLSHLLRAPAGNTNSSSVAGKGRPLISPATGAAQMPGSCPDPSGHAKGEAEDSKSSSYSCGKPHDHGKEFHSAQLPRCFRGESLSMGVDAVTRYAPPALGEEVSPQKIWAVGQPGQSPLAEAFLRAGRVGLAVRSTGSDATNGRPHLLAIALADGETHVVDLLKEDPRPLADALRQVTVIGHDMRLALANLQHHGIELGAVFDTAIAAKLLDGGAHLGKAGYFSLESASQLVFDVKWESQSVVDDIAREARFVLKLEKAMRDELAAAELEDVAELEFKLLPIITEMDLAGVPVDRARWERVVNLWAAEATALKKALTVELGVKNIDKNDEVLAALRRLGIQVERTNGEALAPYMDQPVVQHIVQYRRKSSFVAGAGEGVLRALDRSKDGRVHATLNQIGGSTGRMSADHPNMMGLSRDKMIRSCIAAPPGKKLIVGDYNAIELRILADQTGDELLTRVFEKNGDPHRHTASLVMGVPEDQVTEEQRRHAKPLNFGFSFAMGKDKLIAHARRNYGVELTPDEAEHFKQRFLQSYAGIATWQEKMSAEMPTELRTKSGRMSIFFDSDEEYNARLAFPIQGTAADGLKQAMILLHPHLKRLGAKIILAVHDELIVEAPEDNAEEVKNFMGEHMIAGMKKYVSSVPIVVEPKIMACWEK